MELTFVLPDKAKWKIGKFIVENLKLSEKIGNQESQWDDDIVWDSIDLYLDGNKYDDTIQGWAGNKLSTCDIFEQYINAYLRHDTQTYKSFGDEWSVFQSCEALKEYKDGFVVKLPYFNGNQFQTYNLDLATPNNRYYYDGESEKFLLLDINGGIITDMECFYSEAMYEDVCSIIKDELNCLYKSKNIDCLIETYGGKEGFLKEFDKNTDEHEL